MAVFCAKITAIVRDKDGREKEKEFTTGTAGETSTTLMFLLAKWTEEESRRENLELVGIRGISGEFEGNSPWTPQSLEYSLRVSQELNKR